MSHYVQLVCVSWVHLYVCAWTYVEGRRQPWLLFHRDEFDSVGDGVKQAFEVEMWLCRRMGVLFVSVTSGTRLTGLVRQVSAPESVFPHIHSNHPSPGKVYTALALCV